MEKQQDHQIWISHRGLSGNFAGGVVENSLEAFKLAVKDGFEWLETDLRISSDDHLFLHHDPSMERTAARGDVLESMTAKQIRSVRLLDGQPILFFDEFISEFESISWVLDIKPENGDRVLDVLLDRYEDMLSDRVERTIFQVWTSEHRRRVLNLAGAQLFASMANCYRAGISALAFLPLLSGIKPGGIYALTPTLIGRELFNERITNMYLSRGAELLAFLPEADEHIDKVMRLSYRYILTDRKKSDFVPAFNGPV